MGLRDRGIEIKTPEQIDGHARAPAWWSARPSSCCAPPSAPASPPASSTRSPRTTSAPRARRRRSRATTAFPGTICASVNDEVVHGIPGDRVLAEGDVISIDCGAIVDGWHGDAAITVAVGDGTRRGDRADAGHRGGAVARHRRRPARRPGHRHLPRGRDPRPRSQGRYGILEDYVGHGIGSAMHQPPNVPNFGRPGRGPKLVQGLALAVEPMVTLGGKETRRPRRRLDRRDHRRQLGRPLRAHLHAHARRRLGAHRPRRRRAASSPSSASRSAGLSRRPGPIRVAVDGHGTMTAMEGSIPPRRCRQYGADLGPARCRRFDEGRRPASSGRDLRRQNSSVAACGPTTTAIRRRSRR